VARSFARPLITSRQRLFVKWSKCNHAQRDFRFPNRLNKRFGLAGRRCYQPTKS